MKYTAILALLLAPVTAFSSEKLPVDVTSDSLEFVQSEGRATFSGNVKVAHKDIRIGADKIDVFYHAGKADEDIKSVEAVGKVTVIHGKNTATGNKAVYLPETNAITLTGNVVMVREGNVLKGDELLYDPSTGRMNLSNKQGQRVKASFSFKGGN